MPLPGQFTNLFAFQSLPTSDQVDIAVQVLFAAFAGAIVGAERELAGKQAGLRTLMLVATASGLAVGLGRVLADGNAGDATRVLHGIVTGVGFIGAGAIWQTKERFSAGLTTAATIFLVAILGSVSGAGAPVLAIVGAVLAVLTLRFMIVGERWLHRLAPRIGYGAFHPDPAARSELGGSDDSLGDGPDDDPDDGL